MRAKNSKTVTRGYLLFALTLCISILVGVGCAWFFILTSNREVARIEVRSGEYDAAYERQLALTYRVDSLYNNMALLNSDRRLNQVVLQNRISTQKMNLVNTLSRKDHEDDLLYRKMSERLNDILDVKDSIGLRHAQVEQTKEELQRCIVDNRDAARRMIFQ